MTETLTGLLVRKSVLLLDFDGPVCSIFSALPASEVAARLGNLIAIRTSEPSAGSNSADPLVVLSGTADLNDATVLPAVEEELVRLEIEAALLAEPTPGGIEVIRNAVKAGHQVAIVSNNSAKAIEIFLARHDLAEHIAHVFGRPYAAPGLMKPNPHTVTSALEALGAPANQAVLVGDSVSDMYAATAVGAQSIGLANKTTKLGALAVAGANIVIKDMATLATAYDEIASFSDHE